MEERSHLLSLRDLIRETLNGYVFWSLFQGLGPMIWFYPLNELDISGYEAFAATWFSPILFGIPGVMSLVQNRWVLGVLRLLMVGSLASFQAPSTLSRLMILAGGAGVSMLVLAATLWSPDVKIRSSTFWGLFLGLLSLVTSRVWFVSFMPTWWSNQTNSAIIALAAIATVDQILSGSDVINSRNKVKPADQPYWFPTAVGLGSLIYLTHWCFGEVSLVTRWVVTGFPDHGPTPYYGGVGVFLCLVCGFYMSGCRHVAQSKIWWLIGALSLAGLYYLPTYQGYTGGLVLAVYTMSIWPEMADRVSRCPPARSLLVAIVTYLVEIFFFVWTVAYNFVPGGVYTREHTDYLMAAVMLGIFVGLFVGKSFDQSFTALPVIEKKRISLSKVQLLLGLILCSGLAGFATRYRQQEFSPPSQAEPGEFSAMIWTYHFGYDNRGWPSLERSAKLINETGADFVTLLESDASKPFLGNNDLGMWLGEKLGMYVDFGPATKTHTWGNLILSKYPIVKSTHHLLPSPHGELAPAITATVDVGGRHVDFVVTHMGNDRDVLDRKLQAKFLANELKQSKNPVVFLGYVTSAPGSRDYHELLTNGNVKDIDETDRDRWCEYIMYRGLQKLGYARITHGGLSDTEVQIAKFHIPDNLDNYKDNTRLTTDPSKVDGRLHFNKRFGSFHRGHGYFSDHKFHMSTPKYFLP